MFGVKMSQATAYQFKEKHSDIFSFEQPKSLGKKQEAPDLYNKVKAFADQYEQFLGNLKLPPQAVVNYDECQIVLNDKGRVQVRRFFSKKKSKPQHQSKVKETHCGTFIPFASATGELITTYFILSVKFDEKREVDVPINLPSAFAQTRKGMATPHIFFNTKGYLNGEIWPQIIDHFTCTWKQKHPGLHCCLLGDNLSALESHQEGLRQWSVPEFPG